MARTVVTCRPSDSPRTALARKAEHRVRRVPVVEGEDGLVGVLSIADLIRATESPDHASAVAVDDALAALQSICRSPRDEKRAVSAGLGGRGRSRVSAAAGQGSARTARGLEGGG